MKVRVAFTVDKEVMDEINSLRCLATLIAYINHILKLGLKTLDRKEKAKRKETQCPNPTTSNGSNMEAQTNGKT
jgi:hypothetical protein